MSKEKKTKVEVGGHGHKDKNGSNIGAYGKVSHKVGSNTEVYAQGNINRGSGNTTVGGTVGVKHEF